MENEQPDGLSAAVATGDRRQALEALRDRLAAEVERVAEEGFCLSCKRGSSSIAPLAKRLEDVLKALDDLAPPQEGTALDELKRRRDAARLRAANGGTGTEG